MLPRAPLSRQAQTVKPAIVVQVPAREAECGWTVCIPPSAKWQAASSDAPASLRHADGSPAHPAATSSPLPHRTTAEPGDVQDESDREATVAPHTAENLLPQPHLSLYSG